MRSTYYPGVRAKPGTYYQGWFMYMRYTQGQNEEYLLSRSVYQTRYLLSKFHSMYVHVLIHEYVHTYIQYLCVHTHQCECVLVCCDMYSTCVCTIFRSGQAAAGLPGCLHQPHQDHPNVAQTHQVSHHVRRV